MHLYRGSSTQMAFIVNPDFDEPLLWKELSS